MADARMGIRTEQGIRVNFPFLVTLEHPALDVKSMFRVSEAFDFYEMQEDTSRRGAKVKETMLVDVLDTSPKQTLIKVTPVEPLFYPELSERVERMLKDVASHFKGAVKVARVQWEIGKTGVASDLRGMLHSVR